MTKTVEEKYRVLTDIEHVRKRVGVYAGSVQAHTGEEYILNHSGSAMVLETLTYSPALIKCVNEVLDNTIDEHKKNPTKLNCVYVNITQGQITIRDNGGIPVVKHAELDKYIPEIIFGTLRSGSNYNDDDAQQVIGTNGLGAKLTSILSTHFSVKTSDGKNTFYQEFSNGMNDRTVPVITKSKEHGTTITFTLDYEFFKIPTLTNDHFRKIQKAVVDAAGNNPNCKFYFQDTLINIRNFKDYVGMYTDQAIIDDTPDWKIGIAPATASFTQVSFVNSVNTFNGGTHISYVADQIVTALREHIKKKHKIDVKPGDIKNQFTLFISCNINRPSFNSQTKEFMTTEVKHYMTSWECPAKFIKAIIGSTIVQSVIDWAMAKEAALKKAEERKLNKLTDKTNPRVVPKFVDATSKKRSECMLFLVEGDSAATPFKSARDPKIMGVFPLRGKPINAYEIDTAKLMSNEEFKNILIITGLQIGVKVTSPEELYFGKICIATDADLDGFAIRGLLFALFNRFWPELFELGVIQIIETPIMRVDFKKQSEFFYTSAEFESWLETTGKNIKFETKYLKGLGSSSNKEFTSYLSAATRIKTVKSITKTPDCDGIIEMLFSKKKGMSDVRKEWLDLEAVV